MESITQDLTPLFQNKIRGKERKKLKKQASDLRSFVNNYWSIESMITMGHIDKDSPEHSNYYTSKEELGALEARLAEKEPLKDI